ncbi:Hypothetical protein CAP_5533 [Chondromyces apiculatus DSM 436]|uniref:Uncharacterized protein n=1 Tax=Chondromyces apiculatus DSM 436 TaxID=1192034 RepID=A0A017T2U6_9BACT|nr:Hypothetical protein CAP_5533 [Chondromyces apiculatus DSM 436]
MCLGAALHPEVNQPRAPEQDTSREGGEFLGAHLWVRPLGGNESKRCSARAHAGAVAGRVLGS